MLKLRGVLCPIATPFNHRGELYATKIRHNVTRLGLTKISGLIVGSVFGESVLLSEADLFRLWGEVKTAADDSRLLIAAAGAESVQETLLRCRAAKEAGFNAVWIAPHKTFANEPGLQLLYYRSIADGSPLPVVIGEVNRQNLPANDAAKLAVHPNIDGICSGDEPQIHLAAVMESAQCVPLTSQVHGLAEALSGGMQAAVLPLANVLPFHLLSIEEGVRTREVEAAKDLEQRLAAIDQALARHGVPALKHAMDLRGYFGGAPRLPLRALGPEAKAEVEAALAGLTG